MRERIEQQLATLRAEHGAGVRMLADLDTRRAELQQTLMRIEGAVQVLQELLDTGDASDDTSFEGDGSADDPAA